MNDVRTRTRDDVDRTARSAARFRREPIVHNLEFLNDFGRQLRPARSGVFIVVVQPIDRDIVAPRAQAAECEAAAAHGRCATRGRCSRRAGNARRKQYEIEIVAISHRQLLNSFLVNGRHHGRLRWIDHRRLRAHRNAGGPRCRRKYDVEIQGLPKTELNGCMLIA